MKYIINSRKIKLPYFSCDVFGGSSACDNKCSSKCILCSGKWCSGLV
ncbi:MULTISPECIES: hypothetical protein [Clostridium]|nr:MULTISPECIES: hypothetical protein [Clostridium]